jgi:RNA polymerase sigma-70 factor (ECF subfamily)
MDYLDEQYDLIKASQAGDQAAIAELVSRHTQDVYGFLLYLCGDRHLAEDLSQETFLRALQALKKYEFRAPFRAWLFRIAVNLYRDERRRNTVRKPVDSDISDDETLHLHSPEPGPDALAERREGSRELHQALAKLPRSLRSLVIMRDLQEMSYAEISESLGWRMGTVKSRLFRARQELAKLLRPFREEQS